METNQDMLRLVPSDSVDRPEEIDLPLGASAQLDDLDRRQDDLMLAIDRLNDRLESVLQQFGHAKAAG